MKPNILIISPGLSDPKGIPMQEKFKWLSKELEGVVITPVYRSMIEDNTVVKNIGNFKLFPFTYYRGSSIIRNVRFLTLVSYYAIRSHLKEKKFDVVIATNPLITGLLAIILGKIMKAKVVVEVNGNFDSAFEKDNESSGAMDKIKHLSSKILIPFTLTHADTVKLVYKNQLEPLKLKCINKLNIRTFANFVPIEHFILSPKKDGKYIFLLGYPWYLKGVDLLIKAFQKISEQIPDYRLKIVGWCPQGREYFEGLASGNSKIELKNEVFYDEVIKLMTECSLYVLASRTDSSPRVLREAMAAEKPIVASNIDGVPALIKDQYNGLLFEKEDENDLAEKILEILTNKTLADQLAKNGNNYVKENLSEKCYLDNYTKLIREVCDV